eukprot:scaffold965_cov120-Isochrysis_galbana.AAC.4
MARPMSPPVIWRTLRLRLSFVKPMAPSFTLWSAYRTTAWPNPAEFSIAPGRCGADIECRASPAGNACGLEGSDVCRGGAAIGAARG